MDRQTRRELDRLLQGFDEAVFEVRMAMDEEEVLKAWRHVQMLGRELNALLPATSVVSQRHVASGK